MDKLEKRIKYLLIVLSVFFASFAFIKVDAASDIVLTFSDSEIEETVSGSGYKINGTKLTINSSGTYRIKGSSSEGNIEVKKEVTDVTLILDNLSLTSSKTAPLLIGKDGADVTIKLIGSNTIIDNEDLDNETSPDISVSSLFEGAAIKVKNDSSLTITGSGSLTLTNTTNNAIKGGERASITINDGAFDINAANHGISCDGPITINGGIMSIDALNEGIKISPDEGESEEVANLTINGGKITIEAGQDGIQVLGNVYINNWTELTINSVEDAIQTRSNFYMTNGTLNLTTYEGYSSSSFSKEEMSAKGIKAKPIEIGDVDDATNLIKITGGTVTVNSSDDAIHSAGYVEITRGTFNIQTGDDGVHADTQLTLGTDGGLERDPEINVFDSHEGLEAGTVVIYSGRYYILASDDGINAAGGASSGYDPDNDGHYNPNIGPENFSMYIYGGEFLVKCNGDGLDSNGSMYLYGGNIVIYHEDAHGGNSALDRDANLVIDGATVFTAGGLALSGTITTIGSEQKWYATTTDFAANKKLAVMDNGNVVFNDQIPKDSNFTFYSSPTLTDNVEIIETTTLYDEYSESFDHNWNAGVITQIATETTPGIITYTCQDDSITERKTYFYKGEVVLNVFNKTDKIALVTSTGVSNTGDFTVSNYSDTVTVFSSSPIVAIINHDGESTYDEITPETVSGNVYVYKLHNDHSHNLYIALKGDINLDGSVDNLDAELIKNTKLSLTNPDYNELSLMEYIIADYDENRAVTIHDALLIENDSLSLDTTSDEFVLTNGGSVVVNGESDGTATVEFVADADLVIDAIEANFIPSEQDPTFNEYFTLIGLEKVVTGGDESHDVTNGLVYVLNPGGYSLDKNDAIYRATFKVDKDTPTGSFPVKLNVVSLTLHNSAKDSSFVLTNHIIVKGTTNANYATFSHDEGVAGIDVFYTQEYGTPDEMDVTFTAARNSSGVIVLTDKAQVNFEVKLKQGYIIESIAVEPAGNYNQIKGPADTKRNNTYRITKVIGDVDVIITTKQATEYIATFVKETGVDKVHVYYTQEYENDPTYPFDETDVSSTFIRNGDTGVVDLSGNGQVNFYVVPENGYKVIEPTVMGSYKNIKFIKDNLYRITKVNGDLNITLKTKERLTGTVDVDYQNSFVYNSLKQEPSVTVTLHLDNPPNPANPDVVLVEGTDYTVSYGDNVNVGNDAGTITITSIDTSDYMFDTQNLSFDITPFELTTSNVQAPGSIIYTGSTLAPNVPVKAHGKTLIEGTDYDISYDNLDGSINEFVTVTVTGKGNFTGVVDNIQIRITDKETQNLSFVVTEYTKTYGEDYMLSANHTVGDGLVTYSSSDESVATVDQYGNVTLLKSGDITIIATAMETATYAEATASYELHVLQKELDITDVNVSNKNYDGTVDATVITVTLEELVNSDNLVKGTDFTAVGEFANSDIGVDKDVTITVTLSPETQEKYVLNNNTIIAKARITLEEIKSSDITLSDDSYTYSGTEKKPTVTIVVSGTTLVEDTDYKVEYINNINAGTAKVKITGLGNYITDGELIKEFTINKKSITPTIEAIDDVTYTGSVLTPTLTVKDGTTSLTENDFEVIYSDNINVGEGSATISPKANGNYLFDDTDPACTKTFNIVPYELQESDITLSYYFVKGDGTEKEPDVTVEVNSNELTLNTDYRVEYSNNIDVGTNATVKVIAMSTNYTGSPEVHFEISDKDLLTISGITNNQTITYTGSPVVLAGNLEVSDNTDNITPNDITVKWYNSSNTEIEKPTNVGKYYAIYSYDGTNYKGSMKVNFEITKKESSNPSEVTNGLSGLKDATLSIVNLTSSGLSWDDPSTTILEGNNNYPATYTQNNDTENYTTINVSIPVKGLVKININTSVEGSGGTISGSLTNVTEKDQKTIIFTPDTGYEIDIVKVNGVEKHPTNNQLTVTAGTTDLDVVVKYKVIKLKLTITGTYVDLSESGIETVEYGSDKSITIVPKSGYELETVLVNDVEKVNSLSGNELVLNNITENTKVVAKATKTVHDITSGDGQTYKIDKDNESSFKIDALLSIFTPGGKIYVDNTLVDESNYIVEDGITITFTKEFMDSLESGTHGLRVEFNNGDTATATFKVVKEAKQSSNSNNPKTNDNLPYNLTMLIISVICLICVLMYAKKTVFKK